MGEIAVFGESVPERLAGATDVTFGHFASMVWRRRWSVLFIFSFLLAVSALVLLSLTPKYTAQALITLNMKEESGGIAAMVSGGIVSKDTEEIGSAINSLMSPGAVEQVVKKLHLQNDAEFDPLLEVSRGSLLDKLPLWLRKAFQSAQTEPRQHTSDEMLLYTLPVVAKQLSVTNDGKSYTISVSFTAREPETAALIANTFSDWFIQHRKDWRSHQLDQISAMLMEKGEALRDRVAKSEMAVTAYREAHGIIDIGNQVTLNDDALTKLNSELIAARNAEAEAAANLQELERFAASESPEAAAQLAGAAPNLATLVDQRNQVSEQLAGLSHSLLGSHPAITSLKSRLAEVDKQLSAETTRVLAGLRAKLQVARTGEAQIQTSMSQLTSASQRSARAGSELKQLESERDAARTVYQTYLESAGHVGVEASAQAFDAEITSPALSPISPSFPQTALIAGLSVVCAALMAIGAAILIDFLRRGVYSEEDVISIKGAPRVLGMVPESNRRALRRNPCLSLMAINEPLGSHAEAIRSISVALTVGRVNDARKVVLVTSALPGEGKTSTALSLARLAAAAGKLVLIIECDLRRPALHRSLPCSGVGLVDVLNGTSKLADVIQFDEKSGLRYICAGSNTAYPAELLSSDAMQTLIDDVRATYNLIIIDTPPIGVVSDALVLSTRADATIVVVRSGKTDKRAFGMALDRLSRTGIAVTGVVLTHVAPQEMYKYGSKREIGRHLVSAN
jgi:capsular exopolysaccharide synthesis family protein